MPTLHVLQGPDKGRTYETPGEPAVIGRSSDHIHLSDTSSSRRHAQILPKDGQWILEDLNSSNGTFLNGQRVISPTVLKHGDQIKVGSTLLVFSGQEEVEGFSGSQMIRDLVDFDMAASAGGSSILAAFDTSEESVILPPPETADAVAAWNVVYKVAGTIGSIESVEAFLERVTDLLFDHMIADELVLLVCKPGEQPVPQVIRHRTPNRGKRPKIVTSSTIVNHVIKTKEGVLCANAMTDDRFRPESKQDSIHSLGLRSVICVPIIAGEEIHGIFHLDTSMSNHTYNQEQLRLAVAIGRLAGIAIENKHLQDSRVKTERLAAAGETVAYLSHHIRNILQGMQGGADVIEIAIKRQSLETVVSGWSLVRKNLDRIYLLALNMLTFSKDRQPSIESMQVNALIEDVLALIHSRADEKGVMLLTDLEEMPAIPLDSNGMHQVIQNIANNAIEAAPKVGGRVNIVTRYHERDAYVELAIGDNGPGIPDKDRSHIFDAFHSSKGQGGTGLGLAAAKKIIDELGGEIDIVTGPDEGTTFHIKLPAVHVRLADSDKTHGPAATKPSALGEKPKAN